MSAAPFPIFDLSRFERSTGSERERLGADVDRICRETGFLAISGHGIPQEVIDRGLGCRA